ncbi:MAG: hypothetical protein ACLVHV_11530 [Oscillospiraceae bacterium]
MARARGPVPWKYQQYSIPAGILPVCCGIPAQEAVGGAMESITSRTNPLITRIRKLTGDRKVPAAGGGHGV